MHFVKFIGLWIVQNKSYRPNYRLKDDTQLWWRWPSLQTSLKREGELQVWTENTTKTLISLKFWNYSYPQNRGQHSVNVVLQSHAHLCTQTTALLLCEKIPRCLSINIIVGIQSVLCTELQKINVCLFTSFETTVWILIQLVKIVGIFGFLSVLIQLQALMYVTSNLNS